MAILTKTGTFLAATSTGTQSVSGVGFRPKALILWGVGATNPDTFNDHFLEGFGITTGPSNSYAQSATAITSSSVSAYRRIEACAFIQTNITPTAIIRRADLSSFDADGFTLNWTVARTQGDFSILHYLALGGDSLTGAKAVNWQMATATGNQSVTGVGFRPDAVLHAHAGGVTSLTDGGNASSVAAFGFGAMDASGGQWSLSGYAYSAYNLRNQETGSCITIVSTTGAIANRAAVSTMDADGFTVNWSDVSGAYQVISLALQGGKWHAGQVTKTTAAAPVSQTVTGTGFTPMGVLIANAHDIVRTVAVADAIRVGLGASDGASQFGTTLYGAAASTRTNYDTTGKVYVKDTGAKTLDAVAVFDGFDDDGFTLNWTTNDSVATSIFYLAWGEPGVTLEIAGSSAGTSTTSGTVAMSRGMALAGSTQGTSATATAARVGARLIGASAGVASVTGNVAIFQRLALSGIATGRAATIGTARQAARLDGDSTATSDTTAMLQTGRTIDLPVATIGMAAAPVEVESPDGYATLTTATGEASAQPVTVMAGTTVALPTATASASVPTPEATAGAAASIATAAAMADASPVTTITGSAVDLPGAGVSTQAEAIAAVVIATAALPSATATARAAAPRMSGGAWIAIPEAQASTMAYPVESTSVTLAILPPATILARPVWPDVMTGSVVDLPTATIAVSPDPLDVETPAHHLAPYLMGPTTPTLRTGLGGRW